MADRIIRRSSSFVRRSGGPRRLTDWVASVDRTDVTALLANSIILDSLYDATALAGRPFTITRTIGSLWVMSDQAAAFETPIVGLGMMVVTEKAAALGITAVPTPFTDESDDGWFVYATAVAVADTTNGRAASAVRIDFDSRGQRKVEDGQTMVVVLENSSAADGASYVLKFRQLIKLH